MQKLQTLSNDELIKRLQNWSSDFVARDSERVRRLGEVFTPTPLVQEILSQIPSENFSNKEKTFLDPCCGDGQFLSEVLIRKLQNNISFEDALRTIYGVDIMLDNVKICQNRLLCGLEQYRFIVEKNIVCADALNYDFNFE